MSRWSTALVLFLLAAPGPARAEEVPLRPEQVVRPAAPPDLASPLRVRAGEGRISTPVWTYQGLLSRAPELAALRGVARAGAPAYDPQSRAFYAAAEGTIVEVRAERSLPVIVESVQGVDIDVRARLGLAVSREPDHTIVLHRFGANGLRPTHRVLLSGPQFFGPRFSPDGTRILVSESRAEGGHIWVLTLDGRATDLGQGYGATWHPDGRIVFSRISHDGHRLTDSDLWVIEVASRRERSLGRTPGLIEVEPAISPDGRWLAFQDGPGGDLYLARFPGAR